MPKIVRLHRTGGPEVLTIEDLPTRQPGAGEVRIRVEAIGLNRAETLFRAGRYLETPELPARIGYEAAGTVDAIGDGVDGFAPGDAVSVIPSFSMSRYGVYGEEAIVPARALAHTPAGLSAIQAAALWMQYLTAYGALVDIAGVAPGDNVIIPAASSSVGLAAIQIVNGLGGVSIATTRTGAKRDALLRAGARHVIVTERDDLIAEVMRITGGDGASVVFDPVAGPFVETLAQATARGGLIVLYGILSMQPTPFPLFRALSHGLTFRGYTLFEIAGVPERLERGKAFIAEGLAAGGLKPVIARTFPLAQIADAHRAMEANEHIGKIVVTV
jgi:NADPH:quinone reductase-like Zn-dependent oxidoreductase